MGSAASLKLLDDPVTADLGQLVERPEHRPASAAETLGIEEPVEDLAVVERDRKIGHASRRERGIDDLGGLGIGDCTLGANGVEVRTERTRVKSAPAGRSPRNTDPMGMLLLEGGTPQARQCAWLRTWPRGTGRVEPQGELTGRPSLVGDLEDLP